MSLVFKTFHPMSSPSSSIYILLQGRSYSVMLKTTRRRPFMARMVAQRNSRGFQSTLLGREHALDKHILHLLEKFSDPSFFKKKHGYNVHGQMLGKDGKMIVKVSHEESTRRRLRFQRLRFQQIVLLIICSFPRQTLVRGPCSVSRLNALPRRFSR